MDPLTISSLISGGLGIIGQAQKKRDQDAINSYQKSLQREAWAREDNAVQRRVADLKAAGLSPALAAGSAASSSGATISLKNEDSALSKFGGLTQGLQNAIQFGNQQRYIKEQTQALQFENKKSKEDAVFNEANASREANILKQNSRLADIKVETAETALKNLQWDLEHKNSKEAREWIKSIFGAVSQGASVVGRFL